MCLKCERFCISKLQRFESFFLIVVTVVVLGVCVCLCVGFCRHVHLDPDVRRVHRGTRKLRSEATASFACLECH